MSTGLRKMVVHTVTGSEYVRTFATADVADIEAKAEGGVAGVIHDIARMLGRSDETSVDFKVNAAGIGWVALNPNHIVSVEFHGTEDVE